MRMWKRLLSVALIFAGVGSASLPLYSQSSTPLRPLVATKYGYGSTIVVHEYAVLTAKHITKLAPTAKLLWNYQTWELQKWYEGTGPDGDIDDIAVMVSSVRMEIPVDNLANCSVSVSPGDTIVSSGLQHKDERGKVLVIAKGLIYHTGNVIPGDSGGPLWNKDGYVIGMNIAYVGDWNIAIHYKYLLHALGRPCTTEAGERAYLNDPTALLTAIRKAEGVPSYGVMVLARRFGGHTQVPERIGRDAAARILHKSYRAWVKHGRPDTFISFLGRHYAPVGARNDPRGLNKHWVRNVKKHLGRH